MQAVTRKSMIVSLLGLSLLVAGPVLAQGGAGSPHSVGGFIGFTDRDDADFTFGGEYEYRLQRPWSIGAVVEHTPDVAFGRDFTVVMGTANYRIPGMSRIKLTGGAGIEFRDAGGDDLKLRLGAGYDAFVEGPWRVTPRIAVDFGDGDANAVLGVSALYGF